ncbi:MAG: alpha/beta hydrolase [Candidatus Hydrogenedentes bacterium]|nr:alpha/beta hydrolase [Candidatus Hydrogenedentota bacterium]
MHEGTFAAQDGAELFERRWEIANPRACVVIVHGFGHHSGSFAGVAERLNAAGYSVCAFDQRGHGKSPGARGRVGSVETTLGDMEAYLERLRPGLDERPWFALGHSLGALILGLYALERTCIAAGLIFSSGLFCVPGQVSPLLRRLVGVIAAVAPWAPVQRVEVNATTRDEAAIQELNTDPLRYAGMMDARTGAEIAKAVERFEARMHEVKLPILALHGTHDGLTDWEGSKRLYERAGATDKTLRLFEGGYHELYNDLVKEQFLSEIVAWLDARAR